MGPLFVNDSYFVDVVAGAAYYVYSIHTRRVCIFACHTLSKFHFTVRAKRRDETREKNYSELIVFYWFSTTASNHIQQFMLMPIYGLDLFFPSLLLSPSPSAAMGEEFPA